MKIKIKNPNLCDTCTHKTCSISDVVERASFYNLKSERYTCPVKFLQYGPDEKQIDEGFIDVETSEIKCIYCYLCAIQCSKDNLEILDNVDDMLFDIDLLKSMGDITSNNAANVMAMSYMHHLFDFGANTNLNKSLTFDGYVCTRNDIGAFVEADLFNDSLECCRRILADMLTYNFRNDNRKIKAGIIVLPELPKEGARDVYTLIQYIRAFPKTADLDIYITTFTLLRYFSLHIRKNQCAYKELFFNIAEEKMDIYRSRLVQSGIVNDSVVNSIL